MSSFHETILDLLHQLEQRVVNLERSPQLTAASIKDGALTVVDAAGITRVRIGKDGSDYGVKVFDSGGANPVELATLAFGLAADRDNGSVSTSSTSFVDLAGGPDVTVAVGPSGRALVLFGAHITAYPGAAAAVGYRVSGATTVTASTSVAAELAVGLTTSPTGVNFTVTSAVASGNVHTGLAAGDNTFTLQYRSILSNTVNFRDRWIVVIPF